MWRANSLEKTLILGKIEGGRRRGQQDGWMASPTQWTWVWVNSRSWWWIGRPGMLQPMGHKQTQLNWTEVCACLVKSDSATAWTVSHRLFSMEFSRQEYWDGCHFLLQGILLTKGLNTHLLCSLHWKAYSFTTEPPGIIANHNKSKCT